MKKVFLMRIPDTTTHIARFEVVGVVFHPRHSLLAGHYRAALRAIASEEGNLCSYYVTDENVSLVEIGSRSSDVDTCGYLAGLRRIACFV